MEKTKLNFSVIVASENLTDFVINKFPAWQSLVSQRYHRKWVPRDHKRKHWTNYTNNFPLTFLN